MNNLIPRVPQNPCRNRRPRGARRCFALLLLSAGLSAGAADRLPAHLYPQNDAFRKEMAELRARGITLTDYHIHIRGGMTPQKAAERQEQSGIRSAILENHGREWPICDNARLAAFLDDCSRVQAHGKRLPVGIQVNDRDWHRTLDPALFARLDFVLADTMIMGVTADGKPQRLWLPDVTIENPEAWMKEYVAHNLRILDEPISILANPTYLPPCISNQYDRLWTEARMRAVIAKAVSRGVALEIQAESPYPSPVFITLAKSMGARFSFGSNNKTDQTKNPARWFETLRKHDLRPDQLWTPQRP
jgi:histidinol phosphatase-like PHP family hydrolase